jgi:drug/metabolite transporter (DMT)-like permease
VEVRRTAVPAAPLLQLGLSVAFLGSSWPITKLAVDGGASPLWFAAGRAALSSLSALAVLMLMSRPRLPGRADMPSLLSVGFFQLTAFFALVHQAVAWVPAGRAVILSHLTTVFAVPLSVLLLHESIPARRWLGVALGIAGIVVLMGPWAIDWSSRNVAIGHLFLLAAAFCLSLAMIVVRHSPPQLGMLELLPWCFALATIGLASLAVWHGGAVGSWPAASLWSLLYIGAVAGPIGTWGIMQVSARLPAIVTSVGFLMIPAAGLTMATLREPLRPDLLAGSALILGGVGCAAWPQRG